MPGETFAKRLMWWISRLAGGMTIAGVFFFGTLSTLNYWDSRTRDSLRAADAKLIKIALDHYRASRGSYPAIFPDNPLSDLRKALVDGGYISSIPVDPLWGNKENQYRYVSGGNSYGLLFHLELPKGTIPSGGKCMTGVGVAGTDWWGQPPDCPF